MPDFTKKEMATVIAKARLVGATRYFRGRNSTSIYFLDDDDILIGFAQPGRKFWAAKSKNHTISNERTRKLADLRKRYEHQHNS